MRQKGLILHWTICMTQVAWLKIGFQMFIAFTHSYNRVFSDAGNGGKQSFFENYTGKAGNLILVNIICIN